MTPDRLLAVCAEIGRRRGEQRERPARMRECAAPVKEGPCTFATPFRSPEGQVLVGRPGFDDAPGIKTQIAGGAPVEIAGARSGLAASASAWRGREPVAIARRCGVRRRIRCASRCWRALPQLPSLPVRPRPPQLERGRRSASTAERSATAWMRLAAAPIDDSTSACGCELPTLAGEGGNSRDECPRAAPDADQRNLRRSTPAAFAAARSVLTRSWAAAVRTASARRRPSRRRPRPPLERERAASVPASA